MKGIAGHTKVFGLQLPKPSFPANDRKKKKKKMQSTPSWMLSVMEEVILYSQHTETTVEDLKTPVQTESFIMN